MSFYTYILASQRNGTLYIGSTDTMSKRIYEDQEGIRPGFTATYSVKMLVWYEVFHTREGAFRRERQMKKWNREWKLKVIERFNPGWRDLASDFW